MWKDKGQQLVYNIINPLINWLVKHRVSPNTITTIGFVINILATVVFIIGAEFAERTELNYVGWGGGLILFGGLFDMIDGRLARVGGLSSKFGAFYDSVLDRYSELIMFFGINYYLIAHDYFFSSMFSFLALIGSIMVSYTRARAEALGVSCSVGFMQRPERVIIIGISAILTGVTAAILGGGYQIYSETFSYPVFEPIFIFIMPLAFVAIMANITAYRRLVHSWQEFKKMEKKEFA
ncbi:MAG: CDP-alcohol phosphatidyltransferase family protein [Cyclobacteriaceae bacterium]